MRKSGKMILYIKRIYNKEGKEIKVILNFVSV
jgi:hypothetical protein